MQKKLSVIYCGTPDFSLPVLELLHTHPLVELKLVISKLSKPKGRGQKIQDPPVVEFCKKYKIPFHQTENINRDEWIAQYKKEHSVDILLVLAFSQFLGSAILSWPELGAFNIHTSLLPKYRGAAPIQYALLNGDCETGVSIQKMVKKMDAGDVLIEEKTPIASYETQALLSTRLKFLTSKATTKMLELFLSEEELLYKVQDENQVSFAPTISKSEGDLWPKEISVMEAFNRFRAFHPWPGVGVFTNRKRIKILAMEICGHNTENLAPGEFSTSTGELLLGCRDGVLHLKTIQLEGKKACADRDFLNGLQGPLTALSKDSV